MVIVLIESFKNGERNMEVVKDGNLGNPDDWKAEVVCERKDKIDKEGCGAVLAVTVTDLVLMYWEGTHFTHHYTAIKCPQCGKFNRVRDVPKPIWEKFNTAENKKKALFDGFSESVW